VDDDDKAARSNTITISVRCMQTDGQTDGRTDGQTLEGTDDAWSDGSRIVVVLGLIIQHDDNERQRRMCAPQPTLATTSVGLYDIMGGITSPCLRTPWVVPPVHAGLS